MSELKATQKGMWKNAYDILLDGNLLTKWDAKTWSVEERSSSTSTPTR